jgi:thiopeptide-type bacteriocin biosynthesis protein
MKSPRLYVPAQFALARVSTSAGRLTARSGVSQVRGGAGMETDRPEELRLERIWACERVRAAVRIASPDLSRRISQILEADPGSLDADRAKPAILSLVSYLLRWQRRPIPFGLFAGVITVRCARQATSRFGEADQTVLCPDATWLSAIIEKLERHPGLLPHLTVVTNSEGAVRGSRFVVPGRASAGDGPPPLREVSVRLSRPVNAALTGAAAPVRFSVLAGELSQALPDAPPGAIGEMLVRLIAQGMLLTSLTPPATITSTLEYLITRLREAGGSQFPDVAFLLAGLDDLHRELCGISRARPPARPDAVVESITGKMAALVAGSVDPVVAADTVADARITLPAAVLEEAARAATVLTRTSPQPFGSRPWTDYHVRFRERYGPGAVVPVRELVADSGLGFPAGYLGSARTATAAGMTDRDALLLALIQEAAIDGHAAIVLTEEIIASLVTGDPAEIIAPDRVEISFEVRASTPEELNDGRFGLWVTGAPRPCSSMAGRFAYLLPCGIRAALAATFVRHDEACAVTAQLSYPPRRLHNDHVVRVPRILPAVISLGEHPVQDGAGELISVDDLAVTADGAQFYLLHTLTGRQVIPRVLHALEASAHTPPLARFLAEIASARHAVYGPFDFGAARTLPYLPQVRYGRTVLAPARWIVAASDMPPTSAPMSAWEASLTAWRERWKAPTWLTMTQGELRLPLNLDDRLDRDVLRYRLDRSQRLELRESPGPQTHLWAGRACEFLVPLTGAAPPATGPPRITTATRAAQWSPPGSGEVVAARLFGHPARYPEILTGQLGELLDQVASQLTRWWHRRYRNTTSAGSDEFLWLYLRARSASGARAITAALAAFASRLRARCLLAGLELTSYQPQTGRYGPDVAAVERIAATDSAAAIAQMIMADRARLPVQAIAAASMVAIATDLAPDAATGYQWLTSQFPRGGKLDPAALDVLLNLSRPASDGSTGHYPAGGNVSAAWQARQGALRDYRDTLTLAHTPAGVLRSLLHDHFLRTIGPNPGAEDVTISLARAAAARHLGYAKAHAR